MTGGWWRVARVISWCSGVAGVVLFVMGLFSEQEGLTLIAAGMFLVASPLAADAMNVRGANFSSSRFALWLSSGWAGASLISAVFVLARLQAFAGDRSFNAHVGVALVVGIATAFTPLLLVSIALYLIRKGSRHA